jgi:hypothetical protein
MVNQLLSKAIGELQNLNHGEVFLVKDLFKGYEWNRFEKTDRLKLGILFLNAASSSPLGIEPLGKTSANQQKYKKL